MSTSAANNLMLNSTQRNPMARARTPTIDIKVLAPVHLREGVPRAHLLTTIERQQPRILCVIAPAGYGKTKLLSQWAYRLRENGSSVAWLSLDEKDRNPRRFLAHFLHTIERGDPTIADHLPAATDRLVQNGISQRATSAILNALTQTTSPLSLVLDDTHHLGNTDSWTIIESLIRDGPPWVRIVIAARTRPPFSMGRVRTKDDFLEIDTAQLAFSAEETAAFFESHGCEALSAQDISTLHKRTEGWAAALQLTAITLRNGRDPSTVIGEISGRDQRLSEYLLEEVFGKLPADIREFLTKTAILDRLHPEVCDAITGRKDAKKLLEEIGRLDLFLSPLDPELHWFRYHTLFSEFLRRQLYSAEERTGIAALHRRAGAWLLGHGHVSEAVNHYFAADDHNSVARILHKHCDEIYYAGHYSEVLQWLEQMPAGFLHRDPRLILNRVWALVHDWRFDEAETLIKTVQRITRRKGQCSTHARDKKEHQEFDALIAHRRAMKLLIADRLLTARDAWRKLLARHTFDDPYLQGSVEVAYALSQFSLYSWDAARDRIGRAERLFRSSRQHCGKVWSDSFTAFCWIGTGETGRVEELLRGAVASAVNYAGANSSFAALPALPLADFLYERSRIEEAQRLIQVYLDKATTLGTVDQLIGGYVTAMRLASKGGAIHEADAAFRQALSCAETHDFPRLRAHVVEERLRELIQTGERAAALALAQREDLLKSREVMMPRRVQTSYDEVRALAWSRIAFLRGDVTGACSVLTQWTCFLRRRGYRRAEIRFAVVLAKQLHLSGRGSNAIDALWNALRTSVVTGAIRPFADEGNTVAHLLEILPEHRVLSASEDSHLRTILAQFSVNASTTSRKNNEPKRGVSRRSAPGALIEPLKRREREILERISEGMTNDEVARDLSLSVGTVNWYLYQIYQKFGVHRRTHAVTRARAYGLL